jgi:hypothetical protein
MLMLSCRVFMQAGLAVLSKGFCRQDVVLRRFVWTLCLEQRS